MRPSTHNGVSVFWPVLFGAIVPAPPVSLDQHVDLSAAQLVKGVPLAHQVDPASSELLALCLSLQLLRVAFPVGVGSSFRRHLLGALDPKIRRGNGS